MEIELSVKISEEDYIKINREINKKTKRPTVVWIFLFLLWAFTSCMLMLALTNILDGTFIDNWVFNAYIVVFLLILLFGIPQLRFYNYKKYYRANKNGQQTVNYLIDEEFIQVKTPLIESKSSWDAFSNVVELSQWFLLQINHASFYTLPKNQLNQSQQEWLRDKITKN